MNLDAKFYRALSYLDAGMTKEAITELYDIVKISP